MPGNARIYQTDRELNTGLENKTDMIITIEKMKIVNAASPSVLVAIDKPSKAISCSKRVSEGQYFVGYIPTGSYVYVANLDLEGQAEEAHTLGGQPETARVICSIIKPMEEVEEILRVYAAEGLDYKKQLAKIDAEAECKKRELPKPRSLSSMLKEFLRR